MDVCSNELQGILTNLRRAPPPKRPASGTEEKPEIFKVQLRPVQPQSQTDSNQDILPKHNERDENINNQHVKARASSIKQLSKAFEVSSEHNRDEKNNNQHVNAKASTIKQLSQAFQNDSKPIAGPKPLKKTHPAQYVSMTPDVPMKTDNSLQCKRPPSVANRPDHRIIEDKKFISTAPQPNPLPPAIDAPPPKPRKFGFINSKLQQYIGTSHPPRPAACVTLNAAVISQEGKEDTKGVTTYDTFESTTDEIYDDTACSTADVSQDIYDDTTCTANSPSSEDIYDDTVAANDVPTSVTEDHSFGEDIYEPIVAQNEPSNTQRLQETPPSLPAKDLSKEGKKKKEKEKKQKEKVEKQEKDKEEKERKKAEKEREKKLQEMRRRFSVKGNEKSLGVCFPSEDIQGNRMDITASVREELEIIRKGKPNPNNKWLVRKKNGIYGFIDINKIEKQANDCEDIYEEVPASGISSSHSSKDDNVCTPPTQSPPPPPGQNTSKTCSNVDDIYDDVAGQEELYECLPEN